MSGRIKRLNAKELEAILMVNAFELVSQRGSHRKWWHRAKNIQVVVPMHGSRPLPLGTLRQILSQSEIPEEQWRD
ncbi:MAG: type II toxin-antitoxin system HicA family toxin [Fimbriimonadaceae bacterium]